MSSTLSDRALAFAVLASVASLAIGCGRSPAMPRAPVKLVRVEAGKAVPCNCADDDDDDDDVTVQKPPPVQYVRMTEWQEPESAKRAASEVAPRGQGGPQYVEFPALTLHKPIGETTVSRYRRWR